MMKHYFYYLLVTTSGYDFLPNCFERGDNKRYFMRNINMENYFVCRTGENKNSIVPNRDTHHKTLLHVQLEGRELRNQDL